MSETIEINGRTVELDDDGHLKNARDWSEAAAEALAARDGVDLSEAQWWLIRFVREHHRRYHMPPLMRVVVGALLEVGEGEASSRYLYRLFPDGPIRQACKYAGLPPPESCV